jgi:hypothetical protein
MSGFLGRLGSICGAVVGFMVVGGGCQQCQPPPPPSRGNVDRVADLVVVDGLDGHGYVVTANPELEHLRVLDLTAGRFVLSPNRYFPLSIPTGPATRRLAVAVLRDDNGTTRQDARWVFALDSADDAVSVINGVDGLGEDRGVTPFAVQARVTTLRAPVDLAAISVGDTTTVAVIAPGATADTPGVVQLHVLREGVPQDDSPPTVVALPFGSHPAAVVADPHGRAFVVADAALPQVHVLEGDAATGDFVVQRSLDVDGPCSELAAGTVDVGDGLAPVVLALRSDRPAAMLVRLFRPGFREDRYAVLGGAQLPALGVTAIVADARPGEQPTSPATAVAGDEAAPVTVCCRGLSEERLQAGEATAAFAAVHQADGRLVYLTLAAEHVDDAVLSPGRRVVRLIDDDGTPPGAPDGIDWNTDASLWQPVAGGESFRPQVTVTPVDNFGSPPFVPLVEPGFILTMVFEGDLPSLSSVSGDFSPTAHTFTAGIDIAAMGGRVNDIARLVPQAVRTGCEPHHRARVLAIVDTTVTLAVEGDGSAATPALSMAVLSSCLQDAGSVALTIEAADAFVVTGPNLVGTRLHPLTDGDPGTNPASSLPLPGRALQVTLPAGRPLSGSVLQIPIAARVTTMGLDLPAAALAGGFGAGALVPTGLASGVVSIPDASADDDDAVIEARRMVLSTAGIDPTSGLPLVLTCDEAETSVGRVDAFR